MAVIDDVIDWLADQDVTIYLVGGCVRDWLLGRPVYDLDLAAAGDGLRLARRLANRFRGAYYPLDEARATGRAILPAGDEGDRPGLVVDIARLRGDDPQSATLAADLAARDFTVNALAASVRAPDEIIDLHGGLADVQERVIRPVSEASIRSDPLRALRAVRLAAQLGFRLAPETEILVRRDGAAVTRVAAERIRDELAKLLILPDGAAYLGMLDDLGLLTAVLPELEPLRDLSQPPPHHLPVLAHSLRVVLALEAVVAVLAEQKQPAGEDAYARDVASHLASQAAHLSLYATKLRNHLWGVMSADRPRLVVLKLAALLHDIGKAETRSVEPGGRIRFIGHDELGSRLAGQAFRRLRFDGAEVRLAESIIRHHMRPLLLAAQDSVSARAVYRLFRDTRGAGIDVALHSLADHLATYAPGTDDDAWPPLAQLVGRMFQDFWEDEGRRVSPPRLVNGLDLQRELGLEPGPQLGALIEAVREAQAAGEVRTRAEALALARRLLDRSST